MKKIYRTLLVVLLSAGVFSVKAQDTKKEMDDKYVENDVVSLAGRRAFPFLPRLVTFCLSPMRWYRQALATTGMTTKGWKAIMPRA